MKPDIILKDAKIDWELLRSQKSWLYKQAEKGSDDAQGLIYLLDYIMDQAVDNNGYTEEEVFNFEDEEERVQYILDSSYGEVSIDESGNILDFDKDEIGNECYIDLVKRFDVADYEERMMYLNRSDFQFEEGMREDILNFGYWMKDGTYYAAINIGNMGLIKLESIGHGFDPLRGRIIPMVVGGTYDWANWSHISEADDPGAWEEISKEDYKKIVLSLLKQ